MLINNKIIEQIIKMKIVFVTVGTTKFERLINKILTDQTLDILIELGFKKIIIQIGNGCHENIPNLSTDNNSSVKFNKKNLEIEAYRFKKTINDDLKIADLVISHAGSGSIIESLEAQKKLIVVCNEDLMDNHQFELAEKMSQMGYLIYTTCSNLHSTLNLFQNASAKYKKYEPGKPSLFGSYLNKLF